MCGPEMIMKREWQSRGTTNEDGRDKPERARQSLSFKRKDDKRTGIKTEVSADEPSLTRLPYLKYRNFSLFEQLNTTDIEPPTAIYSHGESSAEWDMDATHYLRADTTSIISLINLRSDLNPCLPPRMAPDPAVLPLRVTEHCHVQ